MAHRLDVVFEIARELNEYFEPGTTWDRSLNGNDNGNGNGNGTGNRPGDHYNRDGNWDDLLGNWTRIKEDGGLTYWRRPGKDSGSWSATTGFRSECKQDLLYCFSSNAHPFQSEKSYSKFSAYALLKHQGDFRTAARSLGKDGYGEQRNGHAVYNLSDEEWIEPPEKQAVDQFPLQCFPDTLAAFAREVAAAMSCPADFPGVAMIALAASAIGTSRAFAVTRKWLECPRMYVAIVADPGDAKSPVLDLVCEPILNRQSEIKKLWKVDNDAYEVAKLDYERKKRMVINGRADKSILADKPTRPPFRHLYATNCTTEAMAAMLNESPKGMLMYQDEITSWVLGMNQYKGGKGNDRQFWLSAWSGQKTKVDRKSQIEAGPLIIQHPFVNVLGGIPPDMLEELCDDKSRQDGFFHRILFTTPGGHPWAEEIGIAPSEETEHAWHQAITSLLAKEMTTNTDGEAVPAIMRADKHAVMVQNEWYRSHARERNAPDFPLSLAGPWSKMRSYFFRLSVVVHMLRHVCDGVEERIVDETSMIRAAALVEYFKTHTRRVYGLLQTDRSDKRMDEVAAWVKAKPESPGTCTVKELVLKRYAKKASEAVQVFNDLADRGFGHVRNDKSKNGKTLMVFVSNGAEIQGHTRDTDGCISG